jgi:hypothetical protein
MKKGPDDVWALLFWLEGFGLEKKVSGSLQVSANFHTSDLKISCNLYAIITFDGSNHRILRKLRQFTDLTKDPVFEIFISKNIQRS